MKKCIICQNELEPVQKLFCSNACYDKGIEFIKKEREYLRQEKENVELEFEIIHMRKEAIIQRESIGFDSPFHLKPKSIMLE